MISYCILVVVLACYAHRDTRKTYMALGVTGQFLHLHRGRKTVFLNKQLLLFGFKAWRSIVSKFVCQYLILNKAKNLHDKKKVI